MRYSIIILNYNVKYFVDACLQTILKATHNKSVEIIVADNNSTDGSKAYLESKYSSIKFLWFPENSGFAKAYNQAVKVAQGTYVLLLNPDTLISEDLLEQLDNFISSHPDFGIIGGQMIDGTGHFLPESKRAIPTAIAVLSKLLGLYKKLNFYPFTAYYATHIHHNQTAKVDILTGAFMCLNKKVFLELNGFDEQFFMYGEDVDLSYRVLKSGRPNYYLSSAKIIHFKGESAGKSPDYYQNFYQSTLQFYRKHFQVRPWAEFVAGKLLKVWLWFRKQQKTSKLSRPVFEYIYFLGNEKEYRKIKEKYPSAHQISKFSAIDQFPALLIFDTETYKMSTIISWMVQLKNKPVFFRFYFPKSNIIIGSDSKDQLGKVQKVY